MAHGPRWAVSPAHAHLPNGPKWAEGAVWRLPAMPYLHSAYPVADSGFSGELIRFLPGQFWILRSRNQLSLAVSYNNDHRIVNGAEPERPHNHIMAHGPLWAVSLAHAHLPNGPKRAGEGFPSLSPPIRRPFQPPSASNCRHVEPHASGNPANPCQPSAILLG